MTRKKSGGSQTGRRQIKGSVQSPQMVLRAAAIQRRLNGLGFNTEAGVAVPGEQELRRLDDLDESHIITLEGASDAALRIAYMDVTNDIPPRERRMAVAFMPPRTTAGQKDVSHAGVIRPY